MMIKAVVLDIGGVLLRTEDHVGRQKIEHQYHLPPGGSEKLVFESAQAKASTVGKLESQAIWDNVSNQLSLSKEDLEAFKLRFWSGDHLDQQLIEFIKSLRPKYTTALLSNAWMYFREVLYSDYGIEEGKTVDHILISSELGIAKPDPEIYQILAIKLNCDLLHILFIDDFLENVEAAHDLGIQTIHYQKGMDLINEIKLRLN